MTPSSENALIPVSAKALIQQQGDQIAALQIQIQQLGALMLALNTQIDKLKKQSDQRITIQSQQAKALKTRIRDRARELCDKHGFPYQAGVNIFSRAILAGLKAQYGITDIHDLPAAYFDIAGRYIDNWTSYGAIRKVREKIT